MAYRESHELPYQSGLKEKFLSIGPVALSLGETGWVALGITLTYKMAQTLPPIPLISFPFNYFLNVIPLLITYFFSKARHPSTGITLWQYIGRWGAIRYRPRVFYYRKVNTVKGGDRYI